MAEDLKSQLVSRLRQAGAFEARVADPHAGYEHVLPGKHPLELWPSSRSVVVFAVACPPAAMNTYLGPYAPWPGERDLGPVPAWVPAEEHAMDRLARLFTASIRLKGLELLAAQGQGVSFLQPQLKLSAYEAGLGVYGRSGIIIHPVLGSRLVLGTILTDAALAPDPRLAGFDPCTGCDRCILKCPAKALDPALPYPHSYSREKCQARRAQLGERRLFCHNCLAVCPAGRLGDEALLRSERARSLRDGLDAN